jgi:hypothetical protein
MNLGVLLTVDIYVLVIDLERVIEFCLQYSRDDTARRID